MNCAGTHTTVADVSNADEMLFLQPRPQQYSGHHWNHVAQMGDWTNEAALHITKMNIQISATRGSPGLGHVLRKDVARPDSLNEHCTEIAYQGSDEVMRLQRISTTDRGSFLAQRAKYSPHRFGLSV